MVKRMRWCSVLVAAGCSLTLLAPVGVDAQKTKEFDKSKEEISAEVVNDLMTAYRLRDLGRKRKAPEMLIAAAGMLQSLSKVKMFDFNKDEQPTTEDEKGQKVANQPNAEPRDLGNEANELFEEAEVLGLERRLNLGGLIRLVKEQPIHCAVVGGPRQIQRKIAGKHTEVFQVHFRADKPVAIGFLASHSMHIQALRTDANHVWVNALTMHTVHNQGWLGGKKGSKAAVTIRIHNPMKRPGQIVLFLN